MEKNIETEKELKEEERRIKYKPTKSIQCVDCGEWIEVEIDNKRTCRCEECQLIHTREYERIKKRKQRQK